MPQSPSSLVFIVVFATIAVVVARSERPPLRYTVPGGANLHPGNHSFKVDDNVDVRIEAKESSLRFTILSSKGLDPFRLRITDLNGNPRFLQSGPVAVLAREVTLLEELPRSALPRSGDLQIELREIDIAKITFSYKFERPLQTDPNLYDARIANSSFGTYFMLNVTNTSISWFVKRRPPIPGFFATVTDGKGELVSQAPVNNVPADGIGFSNVIDKTKDYGDVDLSSVTLSVTFYESPRDVRVIANVSVDEALDAIAKRGFADVPSNDGALSFRLSKQRPDDKALTVVVIQNSPIRNLLLRALDASGAQIFAEAEPIVPFVAADSTETQFGWVRALPIDRLRGFVANGKRANVDDDDDDDDEADAQPANTFVLEAYFDRRQQVAHSTEASRIDDVLYFIKVNGGSVGPVAPRMRGTSSLTLVTTAAVRAGQQLFSIPFRLLLQHQVCDAVPAIKSVLQSERWQSFVEKKPATFSAVASVAMCVVMKPNSPFDGTNWRTVFDSFFPKTPPLPMFWPETEVEALLGWSGVKTEVELQRRSWEEEHRIINEVVGQNLTRRVALDDYNAARGHLLSTLINVSGSLVLPPLLNVLAHNDDPNAAGSLDAANKRYVVYALRDLPEGQALTVDRGARDKFKGEFLVHFGSVPRGAVDSVSLAGLGVALTMDKRSRNAALAKLRISQGEADPIEAFAAVVAKRLKELPRDIPTDASPDQRRVSAAQRLLKAERAVLEAHLTYLEDDKTEL